MEYGIWIYREDRNYTRDTALWTGPAHESEKAQKQIEFSSAYLNGQTTIRKMQD